MSELVDEHDLGSCVIMAWGFESPLPHHILLLRNIEKMAYKIAILQGDGVGPEVTSESIKCLNIIGEKFNHIFDIEFGLIGGTAIDSTGNPFPQKTEILCEKSDAILFGAVGGPKWDNNTFNVRPEGGILALRKKLKTFANLRPVKVFPSLINSSPIKPKYIRGVDILIVRELTGGLYFAKPKKRWNTSTGQRGIDTLKYTEKEIERILNVGFQLAQQRRKKLTSVDKFNVLESSRLWRELAIKISNHYPEVELEHILVDNMAMKLISQPKSFDVVVSENTFGDIISDEAAIISSSLGMLPSASISNLNSNNKSKYKSKFPFLYEPIHGSAPDIAGQNKANPIGSILSLAMMLEFSFGLSKESKAIEKSVKKILSQGYRTADIASNQDITVSTSKMGDLISKNI